MKKKKGFGLGISLIAIMLIVCIVLSNHDDDWRKERYILWNYER